MQEYHTHLGSFNTTPDCSAFIDWTPDDSKAGQPWRHSTLCLSLLQRRCRIRLRTPRLGRARISRKLTLTLAHPSPLCLPNQTLKPWPSSHSSQYCPSKATLLRRSAKRGALVSCTRTCSVGTSDLMAAGCAACGAAKCTRNGAQLEPIGAFRTR